MAYGNNSGRNIEELEHKLQQVKQMQQNIGQIQNNQVPIQNVQQNIPSVPQQVQGPVTPQLTQEQIEQEKEILSKFMEVNYGETVESFDKKLAAFKEAWLIEHDPKKVSKSMIDEQLRLLRKSYVKPENKGDK